LGPTSNNGGGQAAFAATGTLFYIPGGGRGYERTLTWVDRAGTEQRIELPPRAYDDPRLSPDGERVVLSIDEGNKTDVWVYNLPRGTLMRLTVDGLSAAPIWTSDGKKITYSSGTGPPNFFWKPEDVSGPEERLTTSENAQFSAKWSPDGETLAYTQVDLTTFGSDIWMLSLKNGRKAEPLLRTPFNEKSLAFSANGRWIAYQSDESGRDEVYVQPFPGPGRKDLVSTDGGTDPVWSRDGHELFYRNGDKMMAVATIAQPTLQTSKPEILFEKPFYAGSYDVTSNGRRFLMLKENEDVAAATHINVVESWFEGLKRLVPTK
jgi:serine/threonine-protein kinase